MNECPNKSFQKEIENDNKRINEIYDKLVTNCYKIDTIIDRNCQETASNNSFTRAFDESPDNFIESLSKKCFDMIEFIDSLNPDQQNMLNEIMDTKESNYQYEIEQAIQKSRYKTLQEGYTNFDKIMNEVRKEEREKTIDEIIKINSAYELSLDLSRFDNKEYVNLHKVIEAVNNNARDFEQKLQEMKHG